MWRQRQMSAWRRCECIEYARAVQLQERKGNAGPHMYRAYGLANYAHGVLEKAQPVPGTYGSALSFAALSVPRALSPDRHAGTVA